MENETQPNDAVSTDVHDRFDSWLKEPETEGVDKPTDEQADDVEIAEDSTETPEGDDDEADSEDDFETLNIDGEEVTLPKDVAAKVTTIKKRLEADYTRKTQDAAEMRRGAEQYQQQVQKQAVFQQENTELLVNWQTTANQLKDYENVDWATLAEQDIGAYSRHKEIRDSLRARQQEIAGDFQQRQQAAEQQQADNVKHQWQTTVDTVKRAIPEYDEQMDKKAVATAVKLGEKYGIKVDPATLGQTLDPLVWFGLVELSKYLDIVDKRPVTQKQVVAKLTKPGLPPKSSQQNQADKIRGLLAKGRLREAAQI